MWYFLPLGIVIGIVFCLLFLPRIQDPESFEEKEFEFCKCKQPTSGYKDDDYWICSLCEKIVEPPKNPINLPSPSKYKVL